MSSSQPSPRASSRSPRRKKNPPENIAAEPTPSSAPQEQPETPTRRWFPRTLSTYSRRAMKEAVDLERQLLFSLRPAKWPSFRQFRHCYRIFSPTERGVVMTCVAVITASLVWIGINDARTHLVIAPADGGTYTEGLVGQPQFVNPLLATTSADTDLTRLIYSGLFRYDESLTLQPDLASGYTMNSDGTVYTVTLRPNLTWHDGEPVTADDIIFTYESAVQPDLASPLAPALRGVVVEKLDDQTIRFTLSNPYPPFLNILTTGIVPKHLWSSTALAQWRTSDYNVRPVGAGPWQYDSAERDPDGTIKSYLLTRAAPRAGTPTPHLDQLTFRFFPDDLSAENALGTKTIQGLSLLSHADLASLPSSHHLVDYPVSFPAVTGIFFNLNAPSPLQTLGVRQALRAAIDPQALVTTATNGDGTAVTGPFPTTAAPRPTLDNNDPTALLTAAGWTRDGALWKDKNGNTLSVSLTVIDREPDQAVGEFVLKAWQDIGVDTHIDLVSPATAEHVEESVLRPRSYQALLYTEVYGATPDPYPFWHSSQRNDPGLNLSLYSNKTVDDAIELARKATTPSDVRAALTTAQNQIMADVPAIFLYAPIRHYLVSDEIGGIAVDQLTVPADRFNGLSDWYTHTSESFH